MVRSISIFLVLGIIASLSFSHPINVRNVGKTVESAGIQGYDDFVKESATNDSASFQAFDDDVINIEVISETNSEATNDNSAPDSAEFQFEMVSISNVPDADSLPQTSDNSDKIEIALLETDDSESKMENEAITEIVTDIVTDIESKDVGPTIGGFIDVPDADKNGQPDVHEDDGEPKITIIENGNDDAEENNSNEKFKAEIIVVESKSHWRRKSKTVL